MIQLSFYLGLLKSCFSRRFYKILMFSFKSSVRFALRSFPLLLLRVLAICALIGGWLCIKSNQFLHIYLISSLLNLLLLFQTIHLFSAYIHFISFSLFNPSSLESLCPSFFTFFSLSETCRLLVRCRNAR